MGESMPSGYTHMMLSRKVRNQLSSGSSDLGPILQSKGKYFQLGALAPDLPYSQLVSITGENKIADKFHYEKTNEVFLNALDEIKSMPDGDKKYEAFAFFLGLASHICADGVIHPFVRDKIGDYDNNATAHRTLEMRIDVYLYDHIFNGNLNFSDVHDQMLDVLKKDFTHVSGLFANLIQKIYGATVDYTRIEAWIKSMHQIFATAEGENNHYYAKLGLGNFLFPDIKDIRSKKEADLLLKNNEAKDRRTNFLNRDISFLKDCIPMYEKVFSNVATKAYDYVFEGKGKLTQNDFPAINLDTGRSLSIEGGKNLDQPVVLWS